MRGDATSRRGMQRGGGVAASTDMRVGSGRRAALDSELGLIIVVGSNIVIVAAVIVAAITVAAVLSTGSHRYNNLPA